MIGRITGRNHGMKEADYLRFVQAFLISRTVYMTPYFEIRNKDLDTIDVITRKAYKRALRLLLLLLLPNTFIERLLGLGIHNTATGLIEAHLTSQPTRTHVADAQR
ncbi:hypothetical protein HPB48_009321 [Haemaphysalis longicornis]|uniref:Uncharacterized protein n=1 Tax=Haemaphysalis longicornis TaxID=44386 RepID=A0A9J6G762_HAELO|nr:hypothetical protein HPB48_009321 [Haemaphysalis longicornis]